jgi:hypothetical protein
MTGLKRFATEHPVWFGVLITFSGLVFYIVAGVFAALVAPGDVSRNWVEAMGRFAGAGLFLLLLWRFGWLDASGATSRGVWLAWLVTLLLVAYETVAYQFAYFGNLTLNTSNPSSSVAVGMNALATGPIEELPFRGLILYAFVRLWGNTRWGLFRAVLYSSALFSLSHLIHLALGRPLDMVTMKLVVTFLSGIYFAALVLRWKTIWTVVMFHGVLNAVMTIRAVAIQGFSETAEAVGGVILWQLPLVALGIYLIAKAPLREVVPEAS